MPRDLPIGNGNILIAFDKTLPYENFISPMSVKKTYGGSVSFWILGDDQFKWVPNDGRLIGIISIIR